MGLWNITAEFREFDFEAKVFIEENCNDFKITRVNFADLSTPEHFDTAGRMLIDAGKLLSKLKGD